MAKTIDIDAIISKSFKFKIFGKIVNVNQPSMKTLNKFNQSLSNGDDEDVDILDVQAEFVLDILNNNTSSEKFTKKQVEELPTGAIVTIINTVSDAVQEAEEDPN